jgi:thymidylate synthase (FAD)
MLTLTIDAPEFVMRQLYKHVVGIEATSTHPTKDHSWSEVSGRYRKLGVVYEPSEWRTQHPTSKQCSAGPLPKQDSEKAAAIYRTAVESLWASYDDLIKLGVSKEQARILLPMGFITRVVWTASLQAIDNFVQLRKHPDAQAEIIELATAVEEIALREFPVAYSALRDAR